MGRRSLAALLAFLPLAAQPARDQSSVVPFVGCASDGQAGPIPAPRRSAPRLALPASIAARLAYYQAELGPGVLAPRGWYCFCTYGSSGGRLLVSPLRLDHPGSSLGPDKRLVGPAIQLSNISAGTSGRFIVAGFIARVFPAHTAFVRRIVEEDIQSASSFPSGPYPGDRLTYRGSRHVEYETPAHSDGLGTAFWLRKNADPIRGVAILKGDDLDLIHLSVRTPPALGDLAPYIIGETARFASID